MLELTGTLANARRDCHRRRVGKDWNGTLRCAGDTVAGAVEVWVTRLTDAGIVPPYQTLILDYSFAR